MILYEALTGHRPFDGNPASILHRVIGEEPVRPTMVSPKTPTDLETICLKAMAKEPDRRYDSAGAMADDLRRYLEHRPIKARRIGPLGRASLWYRRNPVLATSLLCAVVSIAAVSASSYWRVVQDRNRFLSQREMARESLYHSLVGEARAIRLGRQNGYRKQVWSLLQRAKKISTPAINLTVLRHEAVQCLGDFVALQPTTWPKFSEHGYGLAIARHPDSELVAIGTSNGSVSVRRIVDGLEVSEILHCDPRELQGAQCHLFGIAFSLSGQVLATADPSGTVKCWRREANSWKVRHTLQMDPAQKPK